MAAPMKKSCRSMINLLRQNFCQTYRTYASIKDLLKHTGDKDIEIVVEGWLTSIRKQKQNIFFHINDGSTTESLQVVGDRNCNNDRDLGVSCSVRVEGDLVKSQGAGQLLEVQAKNIQLLGKCDLEEYPFKPRQKYNLSLIREHLHLRPRMDHFSSLLKVRSAASMAVHKYFQDNDYMFVHTPVITSNDCEGAGETFHVQRDRKSPPANDSVSDSDSTDLDTQNNFFKTPAFLTVSGQLHLEAITGKCLRAYNFGPTFRAENALGRHHLSEFYMIEAEISFLYNLEILMEEMENLVKFITQDVMSQCSQHMDIMRRTGSYDSSEIVNTIMDKRFARVSVSNNLDPDEMPHYAASHQDPNCLQRMTYTEAVEVLEQYSCQFQYNVTWGMDLQKEHEKFLVAYCGNTPLFVTDYPAMIKPFYARANPDQETVAAVDLLVPEVGELIGGSLREERLDVLQPKMNRLGLTKSLDWYMDLRRFGSVPHGGFGLGFERYLQCILGIPNIKDTIPFPRWSEHCQM